MLSRLFSQAISRPSIGKASVFSRTIRPLGSSSGHSSHDASEPHVSKPHYYASKFLLVTTYLWIFWRFKEDKGQLLGLYEPWKHPHEHHEPMMKYGFDERGDVILVDVEEGHGSHHDGDDHH